MPAQKAVFNWSLDNSYKNLPEMLFTKVTPKAVSSPKLVIFNHELAKSLNLEPLQNDSNLITEVLSGTRLEPDSEPLAMAYAGHQFGHFTMLGDGRAHLLGEHRLLNGVSLDIQLKGSGQTPYSRNGDGLAALGPMLREYIISEAMHALGIPTTRSLAVVSTGEKVYREYEEQGAILTRVAQSHIRVGTFEYCLRVLNDTNAIQALADYTINRHYPELSNSQTPYLDLLESVMQRQIDLITHWLRVGFIHGVMNTDNTAISGETIDYGPCAFMDEYHPKTVFSSIDRHGRYAYANQANVTLWNLCRFAETLLPMIDDDIESAASQAEQVLAKFEQYFETAWLSMMKNKLGLEGSEEHDAQLMQSLLIWMEENKADYTNTFRHLTSEEVLNGQIGHLPKNLTDWLVSWRARLAKNTRSLGETFIIMKTTNPNVIPRNHLVENALTQAEEGNLEPFNTLLKALSNPYDDAPNAFQQPPKAAEKVYQTFCGT